MKKQIILICGVVVAIIAVIIGLSSFHEKDINGISRYEWIQMLVEKFGVNEVSDKSPYFEDVDSDNEYFSCVQSAYEWGIIDNDSPFNGEEACDGEFVAITAMKAVGKYKVQIYLEKEDEPTSKDYIELAIQEKLIEKKQLEEGISAEEGNKILSQVFELYQHGLWKDDVCNIEYQDGIIEIAKEDIIALNEDYSEIELSDEFEESIQEGCIIIFEDSKTGEKIAKKINHALDKTSYILDGVELEEVIESVMISDVMAVSKDNVVSYYELADRRGENRTLNALSDYGYMPVYFDDWKGENFSIQIPIGKEGVNVQISDLYIGTQIFGSLSKGIEYANVQTEADITLSGGFSLEKEESFPIFKTAIVLAGGTAKVDIEFYLVLSLDGSVKIEAKIPTQFSVDYKKGTGIRSPKVDFVPERPEVVADCNAGCYMRTEVVPKLLGVAILDTEADIGVTVSASVTERFGGDVWQCADFAISYPLITITVSGDDDKKTLLSKLKVSAEWEILNEDNTLVNDDMHCEWYKDGTYMLVEECTCGDSANILELLQLDPSINYPAVMTTSLVEGEQVYSVTVDFGAMNYVPLDVLKSIQAGNTYTLYGNTFTYNGREARDGGGMINDVEVTEMAIFTDERGNKLETFVPPIESSYYTYSSESVDGTGIPIYVLQYADYSLPLWCSYSLVEGIELQINNDAEVIVVTEYDETETDEYGGVTIHHRVDESEPYSVQEYFESYIVDDVKLKKQINIPVEVHFEYSGNVSRIYVVEDVHKDMWLRP